MNDRSAQQASLRYAWYVAVVLTLFNTLSFIDRQILGLLVTEVKAELQISDTRIGLLQGLAFGIFSPGSRARISAAGCATAGSGEASTMRRCASACWRRSRPASSSQHAVNLGGPILGPFLPGFFNDYLFRDGKMVGWSLALTLGLASLLSALLFRATWAPYRRDYAAMHEESLRA